MQRDSARTLHGDMVHMQATSHQFVNSVSACRQICRVWEHAHVSKSSGAELHCTDCSLKNRRTASAAS